MGFQCRIPSVRPRRPDKRTCSLCSVGANTNRHSTCTCTLSGLSLRLRCTTQCTRPSLEKSFIMHFAWPVVAHSVCYCANCRHLGPPLFVQHGAWHHCPSLLTAVRFVFNASTTLLSRSTVSRPAPFLLCVMSFGAGDLTFKGLGKSCALVLCDTCGEWTSGGPLSSTCGFMMSARIASPCFPRPRFAVAIICTLLHRENGSFEVLSLHAPSVTVDCRQL